MIPQTRTVMVKTEVNGQMESFVKYIGVIYI